MGWGRAVAILGMVGVGAALVLALTSRTPAAIRAAEPGPEARAATLEDRFTDAQIARHGSYRRSAYIAIALGLIVQLATLVVLARGPVAWVAGSLEQRGVHWLLRHGLVALFVVAVLLVVTMPLGYVGFEIEHAWGRSNQSVAGWLTDRLRGFAIGGVIAIVAAIAFFGAVRLQPRFWWVWAWLAFSVLTFLLAFVWPIVVAPLFNRFEPLEEGALRRRMTNLAERADVTVGDVLVVDASKRSTVENAYVAGIGASRRLVLFDTLLANADEDESAFVVAHELGHQAENHVLKNVALNISGLLVGFIVLAWLATRTEVWTWAGAEGIGDVRAVPLLLLFAVGANLVSLPVENAISRRFEGRADAIAVELTGDPEAAVRSFRRLAFSNLSDLRPPAIAVWTLFSHPPIEDRISAALSRSGP